MGSNNESDANLTSYVDPRANWPQYKLTIAKIYPYLPTTVLVCIMLAMGCTLTLKALWKQYKRPVGIAIGACSQFILFPLLSFGLAHAFQLTPAQAIGFLITACSPGGTSSNVYTYYADGDLPLSIAMTVTASVLALGMMPLNLFIYARSWTSSGIKVPYEKIGTTLASILVPVIVGMLIKWKIPKLATIITKIGAFLGMALIVTLAVLQSIMYPHIFTSWWQVWVISILFPYSGFVIGYLFAFICRRTDIHRRTIAIETGIQNMGVPYTVLALSYKDDPKFRAEATVIPILIGIFITIGGVSLCLTYHLYKWCCKKEDEEKVMMDGVNTNEKAEVKEVEDGKTEKWEDNPGFSIHL